MPQEIRLQAPLPWAIYTVFAEGKGKDYFRKWKGPNHAGFTKRKKLAMRYESKTVADEAAWLLTRFTNYVFVSANVEQESKGGISK